jgi:hypothetical protein
MRLTPITLILSFTFSLLPLIISAEQKQPIETMDINLFTAQFNGKHISEITIDDITNWLGRPSAILTNKDDAFGVEIFYHKYGLGFNVSNQKDDSQQHCKHIHVYLTQQFDPRFYEHFLPYRGTISKNLNGKWKVPQVKSEFNDLQIKDYYDDKQMKVIERTAHILSDMSEVHRHVLTTSRIDLVNEASWVIIIYEPNTKFLEWLSISRSYQPKTQENTEQETTSPPTPPKTKRQKPKSSSPPKSR